jgi:N-dimethylarginine dimethylaminohydrolase
MSVTVQNESATTAEAVEVLMERLPASKVARLLSAWQIGQGDYLKLRDELFAGDTVEGLYQKAKSASRKK